MYLREGEQIGISEKTPNSLPANRYHIVEEKTQRPGRRESNPHPPTLVISSLGQERAASDSLSYRPPQTDLRRTKVKLSLQICVCSDKLNVHFVVAHAVQFTHNKRKFVAPMELRRK